MTSGSRIKRLTEVLAQADWIVQQPDDSGGNAVSGCQTCGGFGDRHDIAAHFDSGEDVRVTYAEAVDCTCTELERATVCHDIRNEPHLVGCPRWGFPA